MLRAHAEVPEASDVLFGVAERTALQLDLVADVASMTSGAQASHLLFLVRDFPRFYSDALERLMFPDWATACFAEDASDPAMWGIYGDGHRGACLIFQTGGEADGSPSLPLDWMVGLEAPNQEHVSIRQAMKLPFVEVRYANEYPEIDFFTSIGTLARSKLAGFWYAGPNGARSPAAEIVLSENEEWRSGYWRSHALTTTTKLPQWSREREHRLVLTTNFVRHGDAGSRKLRYRFGDLAGVAFGAKMAHADKLEIMRVIDRKAAAEGRSDFEFYQAGYEGRTGDVALHRLSLLRFTT